MGFPSERRDLSLELVTKLVAEDALAGRFFGRLRGTLAPPRSVMVREKSKEVDGSCHGPVETHQQWREC